MATGWEARSAGYIWPGYRHRVPVAELFSGKSALTDFLVVEIWSQIPSSQFHRELSQAAKVTRLLPERENPSEVGYGRHEMHCAANETKPHRYRMQTLHYPQPEEEEEEIQHLT